MNLVGFGDSFTEGVIKQPKENSPKERREISFINQLVQLDNPFTSFENLGVRANSNEAIAHSVVKRTKDNTFNCFFLISWSSPTRVGQYNVKEDAYTHGGGYGEPRNDFFLTNMFMLGIHALLKNHNIPHAFINAFSPFTESDLGDINYINPNLNRNTLFDIVAGRYGNKDNISELEKTKNHDFFDVQNSQYIAPCKHPSAEGHKLIAKTLNPFIINLLDKQTKECKIIV